MPQKKKPPVIKLTAGKSRASALEHLFLKHWFIENTDLSPIPEYPGIKGNGRYKFDFAFPFVDGGGVVVEMEGITNYTVTGRKSRHLTVKGYTGDCIKYNLATAQGWHVFRITQLMMRKTEDQIATISQISQFVKQYAPSVFDPRCFRTTTQHSDNPYTLWCVLWEYPPPPAETPRKKKKAKDNG